ncbi:hypothetical protein HPB49_023577 [Dermacentor silvarum]|uniref:Uncharacterized protein n=1 Tax=Dermacentor silvarum TaxID=543639 RepID=A0ACB8DGP9_DERSI|nr:hypothetical protein HPB49_023577 [Dermacentor silvarum]
MAAMVVLSPSDSLLPRLRATPFGKPPIPGEIRPFFVLRTIIGLRRTKPHPDFASPPTPPATPAVMMEVTVEGHTLTAQELQSDDWTPVLCKAYASRPGSSPKPPHHTGNATSEARRSSRHPQRHRRRPTYHRRPRRRASQCSVASSCHHSHPTLFEWSFAREEGSADPAPNHSTGRLLPVHPPNQQYFQHSNNTLPNSQGVITNTYDDETPTQLYQDLVRRNPEYTILAAQRIGKTHSTLITFDANAVPHSIKYMGAIHHCTLYRGSPGACTNCKQPGHRHDVCPSPKTNLCPCCGTQHSQQDPPCTPKCILCEGPHLTDTGSCKGRNLHEPRKQPSHPEMLQQESTHPAQRKQASLDKAIEKSLGHAPPPSHKHTTSMTVSPSLQHALAKSQEEAAAAKAEATAARAEAAALRPCIAKLEAQISTLATGSPISPTRAPTAPQPPPLNPPTDHTLPSHSNPTSSDDSLAMEADTEPSTN